MQSPLSMRQSAIREGGRMREGGREDEGGREGG